MVSSQTRFFSYDLIHTFIDFVSGFFWCNNGLWKYLASFLGLQDSAGKWTKAADFSLPCSLNIYHLLKRVYKEHYTDSCYITQNFCFKIMGFNPVFLTHSKCPLRTKGDFHEQGKQDMAESKYNIRKSLFHSIVHSYGFHILWKPFCFSV